MKLLLMGAISLIPVISIAQQNKTSDSLTTSNRTVSINDEAGVKVIHLDERESEGIAWFNGRQFTNGTIEVDIKGRDVLQKSFVGIAFHGASNTTFEAIYFRPFNFRATDPERNVHAVQYIALPEYDWQKLRAEHHNQYEKGVDPAPDPAHWFHAKIEIHGENIKVFVNGKATPSLSVTSLTQTGGKMIGYWAGDGSDGSWKNIKITPSDQ